MTSFIFFFWVMTWCFLAFKGFCICISHCWGVWVWDLMSCHDLEFLGRLRGSLQGAQAPNFGHFSRRGAASELHSVVDNGFADGEKIWNLGNGMNRLQRTGYNGLSQRLIESKSIGASGNKY